MYDKALEFIPVEFEALIRNSVLNRNVSAAWSFWSNAAENVLAHAFRLAGGPVPPSGLVSGRGSAVLVEGVVGGSRVRKLRVLTLNLLLTLGFLGMLLLRLILTLRNFVS